MITPNNNTIDRIPVLDYDLDLLVVIYHDNTEEVFGTTYLHADATDEEILQHMDHIGSNLTVVATTKF